MAFIISVSSATRRLRLGACLLDVGRGERLTAAAGLRDGRPAAGVFVEGLGGAGLVVHRQRLRCRGVRLRSRGPQPLEAPPRAGLLEGRTAEPLRGLSCPEGRVRTSYKKLPQPSVVSSLKFD